MRLPLDMHDDLNRMDNAAIPVLMAKRSGLVPSQVAEESLETVTNLHVLRRETVS
jgi:hypothetical protein